MFGPKRIAMADYSNKHHDSTPEVNFTLFSLNIIIRVGIINVGIFSHFLLNYWNYYYTPVNIL